MTNEHEESNETEEAIQDISPPKRGPISMRMKALMGLLALMSVTFGVNAAHVHALENELRVIAEEKESIWSRNANSVNVETASIVTATKEYLIYGSVFGKVEVFVKKAGNGDQLTGIDFFFSRDGGEWLETESGMCSSEECRIRGAKAFAGQ